ncbi:MAG: DUF898 domain-containing protein [Treponema sp.]|jgi:uncharacterized membrane protein|nr:DUF898 domain-containing protein [Treponema sp.]
MSKAQVKAIVIAAGAILTFLLTRLLRIQSPVGEYFSGLTVSYAIIAALALIFGAIVGGAVGLFGSLIGNIAQGVSPRFIPVILPSLLLIGLYGFIIGKIFENRSIKPYSNNAIGDLGLFSLSAAGLYIVVRIINIIITVIRVRGNISFISGYLKIQPPSIIINCLLIGAVGFLLVFACHKGLKIDIPLYAVEYAGPEISQSSVPVEMVSTGALPAEALPESKFDGGLLQLIGWSILGSLVTIFTLGICFPWALCMIYGWKINHTVINGRRLKFTGKAINLFGHWILWVLLSVITLGIYSWWVGIALEKWKVKNTCFAESTTPP